MSRDITVSDEVYEEVKDDIAESSRSTLEDGETA